MTATGASEYGSGWYAATAAALLECRVLTGDVDADVCVIGGGMAGLTVARELALRNWSVVLLEADRIGSGGSGRNAGIVAPGFAESAERIIERVGLHDAKNLWRLSEGGVEYVRAALADVSMVGGEAGQGHLTVQLRDDEDAARRRADLLREDFGTHAEAWSKERVRTLLRSALHQQAVHLPDALHIHPLNYALGLAASIRRGGGRIYERTRALTIDASGVRKRVETEKGRVRARHIVLTASGGAHMLHPPLAGSIVTLAHHLAVTAPLGERLQDAIRFSGAVTHAHARGRSHRVVDGDRLLWSGPLTAAQTIPRRLPAQMRRQILRTYPQLGDVAVDHTWSAAADYAVHRMPQIGELMPGLWLAGAFANHGSAAAAMAGDLIARAIHEGDDRWRQFECYGLVWAGGRPGRVAVDITLRASHLRLRMRETFTRRRLVAAADAPAAETVAETPAAEAPAAEQPAAAIESGPREPFAMQPELVPPLVAAGLTQELESPAIKELPSLRPEDIAVPPPEPTPLPDDSAPKPRRKRGPKKKSKAVSAIAPTEPSTPPAAD
jgi:gamma-glutamylputrescine oxidase